MGLLRLLLGVAPSSVKNDERSSDAPVTVDVDSQRLLLKKVLELFDDFLGVQKAAMITYSEVIRFFVTDRPEDARVTGGALVRRPDISGSLLIWLFLDAADVPLQDGDGKLYGRKLVAMELNDELLECFGDSDVLIVR